jgi:hypothetical protein
MHALPSIMEAVRKSAAQQERIAAAFDRANIACRERADHLRQCEARREAATRALRTHAAARPAFFARVFKRRSFAHGEQWKPHFSATMPTREPTPSGGRGARCGDEGDD